MAIHPSTNKTKQVLTSLLPLDTVNGNLHSQYHDFQRGNK